MQKGDTFIDGGNSNYQDSQRRYHELKPQGFNFVDVGTSGGVWGLKEGYSMMIGGDDDVVERLFPIFETLAPAKDKGWGHVGPAGSGHFVKMIHNGIEYGMMQAYAEGFSIMERKTEMKGLEPYVEDSGEGRWTVFEAINLNVAAPVITESLLRRIRSREEYNFTDRMLAVMRNEFGGHAVKTEKEAAA
jgi:6-phosphogluconate dehydrogenase